MPSCARADTTHRGNGRCHRPCQRFETFGFAASIRIADLAHEFLFDFNDFELFRRIAIGIATDHRSRQMPLSHLVRVNDTVLESVVDVGEYVV